MQVLRANIWDYHKRGDWVGVTTNGVVKTGGCAVMGAGVAKQAATLFPTLPAVLGAVLQSEGNHTFAWPEIRLVTFPTKNHWRDLSDLKLIERSARELLPLLDQYKVARIYMPFPGIGLGGRTEEAVLRVVAHIFDSRIILCKL